MSFLPSDRAMRLPPLPRDPRVYQIAALSTLLLYGMLFRGFDITRERAAVILIAALGSQYACTRIWRLPFVRSEERPHLRPLALSAPAHERDRRSRS